MKKIICILSALLFSIFPLLGSINAYAADNVKELNLFDAIKTVQSTDKQLLLYNRQIELYKNQLDNFYVTRPSFDVSTASTTSDNFLRYSQLQNSLKNLQHDTDKYARDLKRNIELLYLTGSNIQDQLDNYNKELTSIDTQIYNTQLKIKLGSLKQSDLDSLKVQRASLVQQIDSTQNSLDTNLKDLKNALNMDINTNIKLVPYARDYSMFDDSNIADKIDKAAKASYDIVRAKQDMDIANEKYDKAIHAEPDSLNISTDTITLQVDAQNKKLLYDNAFYDAQKNIWSEYYTLKNLEDTVKVEQLSADSQDIQYKLIKTLEAAQKSIPSDVVSQEVKSIQERTKLHDAINNYMIEVDKFNDMLTNP